MCLNNIDFLNFQNKEGNFSCNKKGYFNRLGTICTMKFVLGSTNRSNLHGKEVEKIKVGFVLSSLYR